MREVLLSVGIDVGTSTTQVIFSNITIQNMASSFSVPRIEIVGKDIIYKSSIYFTPLLSPTEIDMAGVAEIVAQEYRLSGIDKAAIKTGAVVITGESARKRNASEVLQHLSVFAGSFVVATAGPDMESIIAGRGAGADVFSKEHSTTAANYDIGGGTSNYVMFGSGETICTSCLDIGGRLIKVDAKDHHVTYVAPKIAALCETQGIPIKVGEQADEHKLANIAGHMAQLLEMSLGLRPKSTFYPKILTLPDRDIELADRLKNICFSGGVADYVYKDSSNEDVFRYGDIGILLGRAIRESTLLAKINRFEPRETIRATVVGAGAHITEISGSTIDYDPELLPIKNIPILKLSPEDEESVTAIKQAIESKIGWFNVKGEVQDVAISLTGQKSPSFAYIDALASAIVSGTKVMTDKGLPLVVVVEHDMAQVLGNTMRTKMTRRVPMICLDSIRVSNGDYIDIGTPAGAGTVLPVVVKTLVFS